MKQHIVNTGKYTHDFKEVESMFDVWEGGCQCFGQADNITDFVKSLDLENQWLPFGYGLRFVVKQPNSKNITACLYRNPANTF